MKLNKKEVKVYNFINGVIDTFMVNYNYNLVIGDIYNNKYYEKNIDKVIVKNTINDDINKVELISLGFNILSMLTSDEVDLYISKYDNISNMLELLDINSTSNIDSDNLVWEYKYDNILVGQGKDNEFTINIDKLIDIVIDNINEELFNIDVNIVSKSEEENLYALRIAQNLRLNDIKCSINESIKTTFTINLEENNLKLGLLNITDNRTNDVIRLDEVEIVDYILSNL